jgi:protein LTV1
MKNGGSGFSALVGTKMVPVKDIVEPENPARGDIQPISDILGEADDTLRGPQQAPPTEEIFIDGKSYFSEKMRNPWDCESILSTYSNLDNNPTTVGNGSHRRRRKQKKKGGNSRNDDSATIDEHQPIQLSAKTGLPLGVLSSGTDGDYNDASYYDGTDTYMSVNKGEKRSKKETAEEKKLRKLNVKKERQLARMQKKMMKEAFQEEFSKRHQEVLVDDVGRQSVFRF